MALAPAPGRSLPPGVLRPLVRLDRRLRALQAASGLGLAALVFTVWLIVGIGLDFAWEWPGPARWLYWTVGLAGLLGLVAHRVLRPLLRPRSWTALAALVERRFPELEERLTGSVALLEPESGQAPHGSPELIAALAERTEAEIQALEIDRAVPHGRARWKAAAGAIALVLLGAALIARPDPMATMARRVLFPWADLERIGRYLVRVEPGDVTLARGDTVSIRATIAPRFAAMGAPPREAWLEWTDESNRRSERRMENVDAPGHYAANLPSDSGTLRYRVVSRSAHSGTYQARVVDPPRVASIQAEVEPPAYTNQARRPVDDPAWIVAWQDSVVHLTATADRPVRSARLVWPGEPAEGSEPSPIEIEMKPTGSDGLGWSVPMPAVATGPFEIRLTDADAIPSRAEASRHVEVRRDAAPRVRLLEARRDRAGAEAEEAPPGSAAPRPMGRLERLRFGVIAEDDLAVSSAEIHLTIERPELDQPPESRIEPITMTGLGTPEARGLAELDLGTLGFQGGELVSYRVRVTDSLPPPRGPNVGWSEPGSLRIVTDLDELAERDAQDRQAVQDQINALKKQAAETRQKAEQLRYAADAARRGNGAWDESKAEALRQSEAETRRLGDELQQMARDLATRPDLAALADPAQQIAELEVEAAREAFDGARMADDATRRLAELKQADAAMAGVQNRLEEMQRQFESLSRVSDDRRALGDLSRREQELAERAEAMAAAPDPAGRARLDQIEAEQEQVRKELDDLISKSPPLKASLMLPQIEKASALADTIRALADRQLDVARATFDPEVLGPELAALVDAQKALEADARRLSMRVDPALDESGLPRVNPGVVARAVEPLPRVDLEAARQRMDESEQELRRLARDLAALNTDPKAVARRLARRQQQQRDDTVRALGDDGRKAELDPEAKAALVDRLKPSAARQAEITRLAEALRPHVPDAQKDLADQAAARAKEVADALNDPARPNQIDGRLNEARNLLNRLADALPDANRRRNELQKTWNEARNRAGEVAREVEKAVRETAPQPNKPFNPSRAAADLAGRLEPLARRQAETAAMIAALPVDESVRGQRDRAADRAARLAEAMARGRREALPGSMVDATAAIDRLNGAIEGRLPDDARTDALLDELKAMAASDQAPTDQAETMDRLAAAVRSLNAPEAVPAQELAARALERAALERRIARPDDAPTTLEPAIAALDRLADRLNDRFSTPEALRALAEAERGLNQAAADADSPADSRAMSQWQNAIRDDLARLDLPGDRETVDQAVARAAELDRQAANLRRPPDEITPSPEALAQVREAAAVALEQRAEAIPTTAPAESTPGPDAARALAARQKALADQIEKARAQFEAESNREAALARLTDDLAPLLAEQEAMAARARGLARDADAPSLEVEKRRNEAIQAQNRSMGAMSRRDPGAAVGPAREAAQALEQLADQMAEAGAPGPKPAPIPPDPELVGEPDEQATALEMATRQRQVRERLQAILADRLPPQVALEGESEALGREVAALRDQAAVLSPSGRNLADQVADLLASQAPRAMDDAATHLVHPRVNSTRDAQRRATDLLERAAQQADQIAQAMRSDLAAMGGGGSQSQQAPADDNPHGEGQGQGEEPGQDAQLADARDQIQAARDHLAESRQSGGDPGASKAAAEAMRRAADGLRMAAMPPSDDASALMAELGPNAPGSEPGTEAARGQQPGSEPGNPNQASADPQDGPAGRAEADLSTLQDVVRAQTGRSWGELPGHLRSEILQMAQGRYRDDYARLIRLYFREIAAAPTARP